MSGAGRRKPILLMIVLFGVLPAAFILLVLLPVRKRMAADAARLEAALARSQALPMIQPLSARERALLEDPAAPWRSRIPVVAGDAQRLAHYHRVITGLQAELRNRKISLLGVRSSWNPIQGSYTLPPVLGSQALPPAGTPGSSAGTLQAWVLEAQVDGPPAELFNTLESLPRISPLLEPVALRWEAVPPKQRQTVVLRNLVTVP